MSTVVPLLLLVSTLGNSTNPCVHLLLHTLTYVPLHSCPLTHTGSVIQNRDPPTSPTLLFERECRDDGIVTVYCNQLGRRLRPSQRNYRRGARLQASTSSATVASPPHLQLVNRQFLGAQMYNNVAEELRPPLKRRGRRSRSY